MNKKTTSLVQRLTLTPYSVWAVLFILVPLVFVAYYAFTDNAFRFTFDNIRRFFTATSVVDDGVTVKEVHTYLVIFMRSLKLAVISTILCLLMGYPLAYIMARSSDKTQKVLIEGMSTMVTPDRTPGMLSGQITRRRTLGPGQPRSLAASRSLTSSLAMTE